MSARFIAHGPARDALPPQLRDHPALLEQRIARVAERLHALGPRPLACLIEKLLARFGDDVIDIAESFASIDVELLRAIGGDQFPPRVVAAPAPPSAHPGRTPP